MAYYFCTPRCLVSIPHSPLKNTTQISEPMPLADNARGPLTG